MEVVQDRNTPFYINDDLYKNRECKQLTPGGPIPHNMAKTFDGPPTLERSGSEHRVGRFPSSRLRREDRDERWSLP